MNYAHHEFALLLLASAGAGFPALLIITRCFAVLSVVFVSEFRGPPLIAAHGLRHPITGTKQIQS